MTKSFIDAVLSTKDLRIKPWYLGDVWNAIQLLAYEGDYSQFNNLKMLVELDLQDTTQYWENYHVRKLCGTDFALLTAYGEKSEYRMSVFNLLREFASHPKLDCREKAEYYLSTFLRDIPETHEVIKQIAVSDPDFDLKRNAMNSLWHLFHDASAISIIEDIILTTNDSTQMEACISDLSTFDSPYAYAALLSSYEQRYQDPLGNFIKEKVDHYRAPPLLPDVPLTVAIDSLRAYTIECQNLQWIGGREFVNELTNHLGDARKHLAGKDSLNSSREIEKYQSQINKEYREGNNRDNRFVTAAGWKYLYMEAGYVIARLIQLPRKHYAPLLEQIDSLKSELKHQEGLKNVSGLLLTKSLELFVDQAGKRFQRRDSTGTALNLKLFQLLVDQTNELTDELKTKKLTTYVNDQAYVQLFYRAKYILEDLPQPRESIALPGRIDKELQQKLEKMKSEVRTD